MSVVSDASKGLADVHGSYWDPVGCCRSVHPRKAMWKSIFHTDTDCYTQGGNCHSGIDNSILIGETLKVSAITTPPSTKQKQTV